MPPAIEVQRLGKRYGRHIAIEQINFTCTPGRVIALLGPNGAGKTTLLRCLCGSLTPEFGRCLIHGFDVHTDTALARAQLGFVPDMPPMEDDLRVAEYLLLHARLRGLGTALAKQRVAACLDRVGLAAKARSLIGTLSRGQRSRVAIAEALLHQPPVLVMDEPGAGLDPAQVVALRQLIAELRGAHTVLLATHQLAEAEAVCDDVVVLVEGRTRYQGPLRELAGSGSLEAAYLNLAGAGA